MSNSLSPALLLPLKLLTFTEFCCKLFRFPNEFCPKLVCGCEYNKLFCPRTDLITRLIIWNYKNYDIIYHSKNYYAIQFSCIHLPHKRSTFFLKFLPLKLNNQQIITTTQKLPLFCSAQTKSFCLFVLSVSK